jgi:hypothetical protein
LRSPDRCEGEIDRGLIAHRRRKTIIGIASRGAMSRTDRFDALIDTTSSFVPNGRGLDDRSPLVRRHL